ncbi:hypothetical protein [Microbacterium sp. MYb72]|uniref:hypothetical protein n=1 Tax=Microbacterium sp. MYb72 TaxID=1848693 RepID=UPI0011B0823E|nr:hypothetical protein [Microbacterium sp. MYb72]
MTVREPEWSPWDVRVVAEARRHERQSRGHHGRLLDEATDPNNMGRFTVPPPTTDFAAKALHEAQAEWKKAYGEQAGMDHLLWTVDLAD